MTRIGWFTIFALWSVYTFVIVPPMKDGLYFSFSLCALFIVLITGFGVLCPPRVSPSYVAYSRKRVLVRGHTNSEWQALCNRHGRVCLCCGRTGTRHNPITRDHVIPIRWGGRNTIDNIQPLCKSCNSRKKDKTIDYRTCPEHPKNKV